MMLERSDDAFGRGLEDMNHYLEGALATREGDSSPFSQEGFDQLARRLRGYGSEGELCGAIWLISEAARVIRNTDLAISLKLTKLTVDASERLIRMIAAEEGSTLGSDTSRLLATERALPLADGAPSPEGSQSLLATRLGSSLPSTGKATRSEEGE